MGSKIFALLVACTFFSPVAMAIDQVDFVYRGELTLGDSEAQVFERLGTPLFDRERRVFGIRVKYYSFPHDITIGVASKTGEVADILIKDKDYVAPGSVRYGDTAYKIVNTYGETGRTLIDGVNYYIYNHPEKPYRRLLLSLDSEEGFLTSWRITSLPITDEDADNMALSDDDDDDGANTLEDIIISGKQIDMSAIEPEKTVDLKWNKE